MEAGKESGNGNKPRGKVDEVTSPFEGEDREAKCAGPLTRLHRLVKEVEPWGILIAVVALLLSAVGFWVDYSGRVDERTVRAWQLLTTQAPGNSGKIAALEYLNSEDGLFCAEWLRGRLDWLHEEQGIRCLVQLKARTPLIGIDLSKPNSKKNHPLAPFFDPHGVYLVGVDLRDALLGAADLRSANLRNANLDKAFLGDANLDSVNLRNSSLVAADLRRAELKRANLTGADLRGARLVGANLRKAGLMDVNLSRADLLGANLALANLSGANLVGAKNVTQDKLNKTCGDHQTKLPQGLIIPLCKNIQQ